MQYARPITLHEALYVVALMWDYGNTSIVRVNIQFVDVSALLANNLTQLYNIGIIVWLGLISNSTVVVKGITYIIIIYELGWFCYGCLNLSIALGDSNKYRYSSSIRVQNVRNKFGHV